MTSSAILHGRFFGRSEGWYEGRGFVSSLVAHFVDDVQRVIEQVEELSSRGLVCAGYVAYNGRAAQFHCFESFEEVVDPFDCEPSAPKLWQPSIDEKEFVENIAKIKSYMAAGDTYQVNYTFRLRSNETDATALMSRLVAAQPDCYGAFIECDGFMLCSVSPELFLQINGEDIITRPMKGTRPRGRTQELDEALIAELTNSEKEQAENLMIVDMARNDLGRIAEIGTVHVPELFSVETHKTVHQLTSDVHAKSRASLLDIFKATYPPASITGAPKIKTMEIIDELETSPRGVYTGCIGVVRPDRKATFSVAIRTATVTNGEAEYGAGAGIVWDSDAKSEWDECLLKGAVLGALPTDTKLIETLRYEQSDGYALLELHLARLSSSASELGFIVDIENVNNKLTIIKSDMKEGVFKVRLLLSHDGKCETHYQKITASTQPLKVAIHENSVCSSDPMLRHKTTLRSTFENALAKFPDCDEVILTNERGELTEGCINNLLFKMDDAWFTPPVTCGLLPGTLRQSLIESRQITERVLHINELNTVEDIELVNSVRGRQQASLHTKAKL